MSEGKAERDAGRQAGNQDHRSPATKEAAKRILDAFDRLKAMRQAVELARKWADEHAGE